MKKILCSAILAISLIGVAGCDLLTKEKENTGYFKEYSFKEEASVDKLRLIEKFDGYQKLSKIKDKAELYSITNLKETKTTGYEETRCYRDTSNSDNFILDRTTTEDYKSAEEGLTVERHESSNRISYTSSGHLYTVKDVKVDDKTYQDYTVSNYTPAKFVDYAEQYFYKTPTGTPYVDKDGNIVYITNSVSKNVTTVNYEGKTKDHIQASRTQKVYKFDKSNQYGLTSYYEYVESSTNKDPVTGEWYNKEQLVGYSYRSREYVYNNNNYRSIADLKTKYKTQKFTFHTALNEYTASVNTSGSEYTVSGSESRLNLDYSFDDRINADGNHEYNFRRDVNYTGSGYTAKRYEFVIYSIQDDVESEKTYPVVYQASVTQKLKDEEEIRYIKNSNGEYLALPNGTQYIALTGVLNLTKGCVEVFEADVE